MKLKNSFIFNHKKKLFVGLSLLLASASAYAWCTTHTNCIAPGKCIVTTVCGDDPELPDLPVMQ
jgi:hypothetical protein